MNSARRYLVIALSFAICMTVFAALAPRIAHAVTATMVQVVNTASSAVPVQPIPARQAVSLVCSFTFADGATRDTCNYQDPITHTDYTIPAAKRLVADSGSSFCALPAGQRLWFPQIDSSIGITGFRQTFDASAGGTDFYSLALNGAAYFDPGTTLSFATNRTPASGEAVCFNYVNGHLEDIQ